MTDKPKHVSWRSLQAEDIEKLPLRIRDSLGEATRDGDEWLLVHGSGSRGYIHERLTRMSARWREAPWRQGQELDLMLASLVAAGTGIEGEMAIENLELRRVYLEETPTLTAAQIQLMSGLRSRNSSEPASRWKRERKTFAVRIGRQYLYPAFQFLDGKPHPVVSEVLDALPEVLTSWQTAFWFASGNGWLDGDMPQERLQDREMVVTAAARLSEPTIG